MSLVHNAAKSNDQDKGLKHGKHWMKNFYEKKIDTKKWNKDYYSMKLEKPIAIVMKKHNEKCRYSNVACIDSTRVILKDRSPDDDFIHANVMKMPDGTEFIASQGPLDDTREDHLHMVITKGVKVMVVLCGYSEEKTQKSAIYLPTEGETAEFGQYGIRRTSETECVFDGVFSTKYEIFEVKSKLVRAKGIHFQYRQWPDRGVPDNVETAMKLMKMAKDQSKGSPLLVHCSAGVGRTCSFIGIDYGYQRLREKADITPLEIVMEMRRMRDRAVQSPTQLMFVVMCWTARAVMEEGEEVSQNMRFMKNIFGKRLEKEAAIAMKKALKEAKKKENPIQSQE